MPPAPPSQTAFTKAKLIFIEPSSGGAEKEVWTKEFPFNPTNYSITRGAKWEAKSNKDGLLPAEYNGPEPSSVTLKMFLDETHLDNGDISTDVRKLLSKVDPDPSTVSKDKPSAPHVKFIWGDAITFVGYLKSVAIDYQLFRQDGKPVRGEVTLTLLEYGEKPARQNPTSGGEPGSRAHRVVAGDTLASIAYTEYGSAMDWRKIADANPVISDPLRLHPGTALIVPPA